MNTPQPSALPEATTVAYPLVQWLVRHGVGHAEWAAMLKPLFYAAALEEAQHHAQSTSDSALSLRSGLHRKDVRALRESHQQDLAALHASTHAMGKPSPASRVLARWRGDAQWPERMPFDGPAPSFQALVTSVSSDFHHRAVWQELLRLEQVEARGSEVQLRAQGMAVARQTREARQLLAGAVADHLQAGVNNLAATEAPPFLEQSVFADGLSSESVAALHALARQLWNQVVLPQLVQAATAYCEQDQQTPEPQRFRSGMYSFSAAESAPKPRP